jgi:hypothetical protein
MTDIWEIFWPGFSLKILYFPRIWFISKNVTPMHYCFPVGSDTLILIEVNYRRGIALFFIPYYINWILYVDSVCATRT